jgi:hypothetical protein
VLNCTAGLAHQPAAADASPLSPRSASQILVYELTRLIKSGAAGIQQLPFAPPQQRLVCSPI